MKTISKITIGLTVALLLFSGCNSDTSSASSSAKVAPTITEESLGLRKTDLYSEKSETTGMKTNYRTSYAGSGEKINRAFQDAPPMIPHDTEGMLPIKIGANQCTGCHMPEVASSMGATPIPVSHFTNFRPTHNVSSDGKEFTKSVDNMKNEIAIKKTTKLQGSRFSCTQCHATQTQGDLAVGNTFKAAYTRKDGANKSSWSGTVLTDQLDTIEGDAGKVTAADIANADSKAGSLDH